MNSENGGQPTSDLKHAREDGIHDNGCRSIETMVEEHAHDRPCAILTSLLAITVISRSVHEVSYTTEEGELRRVVPFSAIAVKNESESEAGNIPTEAPNRDGVWGQPRWKL